LLNYNRNQLGPILEASAILDKTKEHLNLSETTLCEMSSALFVKPDRKISIGAISCDLVDGSVILSQWLSDLQVTLNCHITSKHFEHSTQLKSLYLKVLSGFPQIYLYPHMCKKWNKAKQL